MTRADKKHNELHAKWVEGYNYVVNELKKAYDRGLARGLDGEVVESTPYHECPDSYTSSRDRIWQEKTYSYLAGYATGATAYDQTMDKIYVEMLKRTDTPQEAS